MSDPIRKPSEFEAVAVGGPRAGKIIKADRYEVHIQASDRKVAGKFGDLPRVQMTVTAHIYRYTRLGPSDVRVFVHEDLNEIGDVIRELVKHYRPVTDGEK